MKKYIYSFLTLLALILIGCGSDNDKSFSVYDDGNGTKSPRILKVVEGKNEYHYVYDTNNLLTSIKSKNSGDWSFIYNASKQLIKKEYEGINARRSEAYTYSESTYSNHTNLPVITSKKMEYVESKGNGVVTLFDVSNYSYEYVMNEEGKAVRLNKTSIAIENKAQQLKSHHVKEYKYNSDEQIIQVNDSYSYDGGKNIYTKDIYTYDNKQLKVIEHYDKNDNGEFYLLSKENFSYEGKLLKSKELYRRSKENEKFELSSKKTYTYENKPYYEAPSLVHIDEEME